MNMKTEFNNRVELQRKVVKIINAMKTEYQLSGLSKLAIENWFLVNKDLDKELKTQLISISEKLFFIANKSQDQITEEYSNLQDSIKTDIQLLSNKIRVLTV